MERFYSFNQYLRQIFGERVQRISLDAGFNCPNLDGTFSYRGCVYCNNRGFSPYVGKDRTLKKQIEESISFYHKRLKVKKFIAYFQAFTNTYGDLKQLEKSYLVIKEFSPIVGLFISTRPDCLDEDKVKLIASYKENYLVWVELGLQTTHNRLLKIINRNHYYEDFLSGLDILRKYQINVGVHIILGLPGATYGEIMEDAQRLSHLDLQGIKFHILHILKDTELEKWYREDKIRVLNQKEYVKIICDFLERIPSEMVILRLVSTASADYLVAPEWINQRQKVLEDIKRELIIRDSRQGYWFNRNFAKNRGC